MSDIDNILAKHQLEAGELTYALKQDLEAYIAQQVKEARLDELKYCHSMVDELGAMRRRIKELEAELRGDN